jgi:hypothetical protein
MLAFLFGLVLGMLLAVALCGGAVWLVLRRDNRASAAHLLHALALALETKPTAGHATEEDTGTGCA